MASTTRRQLQGRLYRARIKKRDALAFCESWQRSDDTPWSAFLVAVHEVQNLAEEIAELECRLSTTDTDQIEVAPERLSLTARRGGAISTASRLNGHALTLYGSSRSTRGSDLGMTVTGSSRWSATISYVGAPPNHVMLTYY